LDCKACKSVGFAAPLAQGLRIVSRRIWCNGTSQQTGPTRSGFEGFLYVAAVLDVFSRLVVGWAMHERLRSQLVLSALQMVYAEREPRKVIHHSDHGTEAVAFGKRCGHLGITLSMGSVGHCYDNAMMESFFSSLEAEVLDRNRFSTREEARRKIFCWLAGWYNTRRRHSGAEYLSPQEFETRFAQVRSRLPSAASRQTNLR
jgi:transposase InsO family protein